MSILGLSPRVRGNPLASHLRERASGSIPACAGEPIHLCGECTVSRVYPRVCGGTRDVLQARQLLDGLSPRVRGNPTMACGRSSATRSIPACAGEPQNKTSKKLVEKVYPRVCGGTRFGMDFVRDIWGLSPRVRGNLQ